MSTGDLRNFRETIKLISSLTVAPWFSNVFSNLDLDEGDGDKSFSN